MTFGNDEYVVSFIALANQFGAWCKMLEAGYRTNFGRLVVRQASDINAACPRMYWVNCS